MGKVRPGEVFGILELLLGSLPKYSVCPGASSPEVYLAKRSAFNLLFFSLPSLLPLFSLFYLSSPSLLCFLDRLFSLPFLEFSPLFVSILERLSCGRYSDRG